jgi:glycosyltransferase involved in cell wall biosynthesis
MNVCQVGTGFTSIPPNVSAATEEVIYNLSKELVSLNCNVTIVDVSDRKRRPSSNLSIIEVPYFSAIKAIKSNSPGLIARRLSFSFFSTIWLNRFKENFDIIHFHNQFPASMYELSSKFNFKNSKTIFTVHNPIWGLPDSILPKDVKTKYFLEVVAIKRASKVVVVSDTLKRCIINRIGIDSKDVAVIPNGVNTDFFHPNKESLILKKALAPNGEKIVLCVGRISRFKGQKMLIEAIPKIISQFKVKFVFVGPIDDHAYFKGITDTLDVLLIRKHCIFTGTVSADMVPAYFAIADVCALPSVTEAGPPLTLFQAMSSARAIVTSAIPQTLEASKRGDELVFVDPFNIDELACAIIKILSDEEYRKSLGEKARETALEKFDWKVTAKKTVRLYESLKD